MVFSSLVSSCWGENPSGNWGENLGFFHFPEISPPTKAKPTEETNIPFTRDPILTPKCRHFSTE